MWVVKVFVIKLKSREFNEFDLMSCQRHVVILRVFNGELFQNMIQTH